MELGVGGRGWHLPIASYVPAPGLDARRKNWHLWRIFLVPGSTKIDIFLVTDTTGADLTHVFLKTKALYSLSCCRGVEVEGLRAHSFPEPSWCLWEAEVGAQKWRWYRCYWVKRLSCEIAGSLSNCVKKAILLCSKCRSWLSGRLWVWL